MRHRRGASIARPTRFPCRLLEVCKEAYLGTFAAFAAVLSSTAAKVGVGLGLGTKLANAVNAVVAPVEDQDGRYAERGGDFRTAHREWCRKPEPLSVFEKKMADEMNPKLVKAGQAPLTKEELVAGRLYTGPMYEKYNGVLRFSSARGADGAVRLVYASEKEVPFLQKKCGWLHLGEWVATAAGKGEPAAVRWKWNNQYTTTIHAINSIIVKLSPLTRITPLYRGWRGATLPEAFFKLDALGFRGGVEYGFSSTTTDRAQAVH